MDKFATRIQVSEDASSEWISTANAKIHLKVTHSSEDTLIDSLVTAVRLHTQNEISRQIGSQKLVYLLSAFPEGSTLQLPRPPLISVNKVRYKDADGNWTTMLDADASPEVTTSVFDVVTGVEPGALILAPSQVWPQPSGGLYSGFPLEVTFTCGYSTIPGPLLAAMKLLLGHLFEHRESVVIGSLGQMNALSTGEVPMGYRSLIEKYIWFNFGDEQV